MSHDTPAYTPREKSHEKSGFMNSRSKPSSASGQQADRRDSRDDDNRRRRGDSSSQDSRDRRDYPPRSGHNHDKSRRDDSPWNSRDHRGKRPRENDPYSSHDSMKSRVERPEDPLTAAQIYYLLRPHFEDNNGFSNIDMARPLLNAASFGDFCYHLKKLKKDDYGARGISEIVLPALSQVNPSVFKAIFEKLADDNKITDSIIVLYITNSLTDLEENDMQWTKNILSKTTNKQYVFTKALELLSKNFGKMPSSFRIQALQNHHAIITTAEEFIEEAVKNTFANNTMFLSIMHIWRHVNSFEKAEKTYNQANSLNLLSFSALGIYMEIANRTNHAEKAITAYDDYPENNHILKHEYVVASHYIVACKKTVGTSKEEAVKAIYLEKAKKTFEKFCGSHFRGELHDKQLLTIDYLILCQDLKDDQAYEDGMKFAFLHNSVNITSLSNYAYWRRNHKFSGALQHSTLTPGIICKAALPFGINGSMFCDLLYWAINQSDNKSITEIWEHISCRKNIEILSEGVFTQSVNVLFSSNKNHFIEVTNLVQDMLVENKFPNWNLITSILEKAITLNESQVIDKISIILDEYKKRKGTHSDVSRLKKQIEKYNESKKIKEQKPVDAVLQTQKMQDPPPVSTQISLNSVDNQINFSTMFDGIASTPGQAPTPRTPAHPFSTSALLDLDNYSNDENFLFNGQNNGNPFDFFDTNSSSTTTSNSNTSTLSSSPPLNSQPIETAPLLLTSAVTPQQEIHPSVQKLIASITFPCPPRLALQALAECIGAGLDIHTFNYPGRNLLSLAAEYGKDQLVEILITQYKFNPDAVPFSGAPSALELAVTCNQYLSVMILVTNGASIDSHYANNQTLLHTAILHNVYEIYVILETVYRKKHTHDEWIQLEPSLLDAAMSAMSRKILEHLYQHKFSLPNSPLSTTTTPTAITPAPITSTTSTPTSATPPAPTSALLLSTRSPDPALTPSISSPAASSTEQPQKPRHKIRFKTPKPLEIVTPPSAISTSTTTTTTTSTTSPIVVTTPPTSSLTKAMSLLQKASSGNMPIVLSGEVSDDSESDTNEHKADSFGDEFSEEHDQDEESEESSEKDNDGDYNMKSYDSDEDLDTPEEKLDEDDQNTLKEKNWYQKSKSSRRASNKETEGAESDESESDNEKEKQLPKKAKYQKGHRAPVLEKVAQGKIFDFVIPIDKIKNTYFLVFKKDVEFTSTGVSECLQRLSSRKPGKKLKKYFKFFKNSTYKNITYTDPKTGIEYVGMKTQIKLKKWGEDFKRDEKGKNIIEKLIKCLPEDYKNTKNTAVEKNSSGKSKKNDSTLSKAKSSKFFQEDKTKQNKNSEKNHQQRKISKKSH
jgi:hypothetical protein